jgi:phage tail sheath protein FI
VGDRDAALDQRGGLAALEEIDEVSLLCVPDEIHPSLSPTDQAKLTQAIVDQCEYRADRFAVLQVGRGRSDFHAIQPPLDTRCAALYFPWIRVMNGPTGEPLLIPPGGHVAGVFARTDRERGVHKAPSGDVGGLAPGLQPLEFTLTPDQHESLNSRGINTLREFAGGSVRVWGARTLSHDPDWRYVPVRRLLLFILESIEEGIQWAVFEPNDEPLWARVRASISSFLFRVWQAGALIGSKQGEVFFVRCDRTTMTQDDIDRGRLIVLVGVAPLRPAEFVFVRIEQMVRPPGD